MDVLINNAGVGVQALFDLADWGRIRTLLLTNVFAVTRLTAALVPAMVERGPRRNPLHGPGRRAGRDARSGGLLG